MNVAALDLECYVDYFLVMFKNAATGNIKYFEQFPGQNLDCDNIRKVLGSYQLITFNGIGYDIPMLFYALTGASCENLKKMNDYIIGEGRKPWQCETAFKFQINKKINHIDLMEVAPGKGGLKLYGGRLHSKRLQDLPIEPSASITEDLRLPMREYCGNDLQITLDLYEKLKPQLALRAEMSKIYGIDLMSKSDAQIAEHVIKKEVEKLTHNKVEKPEYDGKSFKYKKPDFISFETDKLQKMLDLVCSIDFVMTEGGKVILPKELGEIKIAAGSYAMGIGGLHSQESCQAHLAKEEVALISDFDVVSYYPSIILRQGLFPETMGKEFLNVYKKIVEERINAKISGDKVKSESLKITINGSFGKFGSRYSYLYSPNLLIQTTMTGQLALLMLIEQFTTSGFFVVSANTDGLVLYYSPKDKKRIKNIIAGWELITGFDIEETGYKALYSRDVNNYIGLKEGGGTKLKGAYSPAGLAKNPTNEICSEAAIAYLERGESIEKTIKNCKDIRKFITIRTVKGGAVKDDQYLGRVVRWYYSYLAFGHISYKVNGYMVPRSEGAMPCMMLPDEFPDDIAYEWYIQESQKILSEIGAGTGSRKILKKAS